MIQRESNSKPTPSMETSDDYLNQELDSWYGAKLV